MISLVVNSGCDLVWWCVLKVIVETEQNYKHK